MKNILALFNEKSQRTLPVLINIAKAGSFNIKGVFLKQLKSSIDFQYPFLNDISLVQSSFFKYENEQEELELETHSIELLKKEYADAGICFDACTYTQSSLEDLMAKSASTDLLMLDGNLNLKQYLVSPLNISLKDILVGSSCPVILFTEQEASIEKVIIAYDGSSSNLHAIKMYTDLFQKWSNLPTILVSVNSTDKYRIHDHQHINEWLSEHFKNFQSETLNGDVNDKLVHFVQQQPENVLIVMGAYEGGAFSNLFHKSLSGALLKQTRASLFIAHNN